MIMVMMMVMMVMTVTLNITTNSLQSPSQIIVNHHNQTCHSLPLLVCHYNDHLHYHFQHDWCHLSVFSRTPLAGPRQTLRPVSPSNCLEEVIESATLNPLCYPNSYLSELHPEAAVPDFH